MDYRVILLFLTTSINLGLALFIFFKDFKSRVNVTFSLMLLFIGLWSSEIGLWRLSSDPITLRILFNLFYLTAAFIVLTFYYFTLYFPFQTKSISKFANLINVGAFVAITLVIFFVGIVDEIYIDPAGDHTVQLNPLSYLLYNSYFFSFIVASFIMLSKKFINSSSYHKKLIGIVLGATLLAAIAGAFFDLFLPLFTYKYIWIGPYFTMLMVFIIVRYVFIKQPD